MKINTNNLIKFDAHLGRWKKSIKNKNEFYYYSRNINIINEVIKNLITFRSLSKSLLMSRNKIIFLNTNSVLEELIENLAVESGNIYAVPTNSGYFSNTSLYDASLKNFNYWSRTYSASILFDAKGLENFVKELNSINIPVFSLSSSVGNYWVSENTVSINIWLLYFTFLKKLLLNNVLKKSRNNVKVSKGLTKSKETLIRNKLVLTAKSFKIKTKWKLQKWVLTKIKKIYAKKKYKQKTLKKKV